MLALPCSRFGFWFCNIHRKLADTKGENSDLRLCPKIRREDDTEAEPSLGAELQVRPVQELVQWIFGIFPSQLSQYAKKVVSTSCYSITHTSWTGWDSFSWQGIKKAHQLDEEEDEGHLVGRRSDQCLALAGFPERVTVSLVHPQMRGLVHFSSSVCKKSVTEVMMTTVMHLY